MGTQGLCAALAEAFTVHGYQITPDAALEGRSGNVYTAPLLVETDEAAILVEPRTGVTAITKQDILDIRSVLADVGADFSILAHDGDVETEALQEAEGEVILWGPTELATVFGEACLARALGRTPPRLPLEFPVAVEPVSLPTPDPVREDTPPVPPEDMIAATGPDDHDVADLEDLLPDAFQDLHRDEAVDGTTPPDGDIETGQVASDPDRPASEPTPAVPEKAPAPSHPLLPLRLSEDMAVSKARDRLFDVRYHELLLNPVYVFDYACELLVEGSLKYDTVTGRILVHSSTKKVEFVDPGETGPDAPTMPWDTIRAPVEERTARISEDRARVLALEAVRKAHTRLVDVTAEDDDQGLSYTEKKQVRPLPEHVRLEPQGMHLRGVWRVKGPNGHIDLDAFSGEELDSALRTPHADVMVLD